MEPNPKEYLTVSEDIKDLVRRSQTGQTTSSRSLSAVLEDEREPDRVLIEVILSPFPFPFFTGFQALPKEKNK